MKPLVWKCDRHTLQKTLRPERKSDWYGKIILNGIETKLHWKYINK